MAIRIDDLWELLKRIDAVIIDLEQLSREREVYGVEKHVDKYVADLDELNLMLGVVEAEVNKALREATEEYKIELSEMKKLMEELKREVRRERFNNAKLIVRNMIDLAYRTVRKSMITKWF